MSPELVRVALQMAMWILLVASALLLFLDRNSPEFVITVISLVIGLLFTGLVWFLARRSFR